MERRPEKKIFCCDIYLEKKLATLITDFILKKKWWYLCYVTNKIFPLSLTPCNFFFFLKKEHVIIWQWHAPNHEVTETTKEDDLLINFHDSLNEQPEDRGSWI